MAAKNYRSSMDQNDIVRTLTTTIQSFIQDRLISKEQRAQHKEQCAERLAAEDQSSDNDKEVRYSDQAVLANLDWGIDALEEAINTSNIETKLARLDYAEKMLQVCAMLNSDHKTAGVPNFYLSAWAHLNLSYMWMLRNNVHNSVLVLLEMFTIDPFFARIDFAPELWKELFLPHMGSVVGWYSEARHRLVMETIPDSADLSFTADVDQFFNESLVFSMRPDQVEKVQNLEQLYGEALDENTRLYAKYYKDCMNSDPATSKKAIPMMPIVEPPMTPLHELSRAIPDYVKFGPILPKSAGFSPVLRNKNSPRDHDHAKTTRTDVTSSTTHDVHESDLWDPQEGADEDGPDYEPDDAYTDEEDKNHESIQEEVTQRVYPYKPMSRGQSPSIFTPVDSPHKTLSPTAKTPSPKPSATALRLLSSRAMDSPVSASLPTSPYINNNDFSISSPGSDAEVAVNKDRRKSCRTRQNRSVSKICYDIVTSHQLDISSPKESVEGNRSYTSPALSEKTTPSRPPKDFVCPITSQIINDPVTLETGQTYERKAIEEWLNRGNTTCPITRQPLSTNTLPKTNYVLKRLITSWKDQYPELAQEFSFSETPKHPSTTTTTQPFPSHKTTINLNTNRFARPPVATSPTSVISQAAIETLINGLQPHISILCTSENLKECEEAVMSVAAIWKECNNGDQTIHSYLSKPMIVNGFVEVLSASLNRQVLRTSVYILSELMFADESVGEILSSVDSDFECLTSLLKNGLAESVVLIYQLRPTFAQLSDDFIPALVQIIQTKAEDELDGLQLLMEPKHAAIAMVEQILMGGNESSRTLNALCVIEANGVHALIKCMDKVEGRRSIVYILLYCIYADKSCRSLIAGRIDLSSVLELFHAGNDGVKGICIDFLSEIVQLDRRTLCNQMLQTIKDGCEFSTMHAFLVYLQMAPMEQQPSIASLLLQLDLLVEPWKMSMYREEAIDALVEALKRKDFPNYQFLALDALLSLSGRWTASGKSYVEVWLLKIAGFDQPYYNLMKAEKLTKSTHDIDHELTETLNEEEMAASSWEKRVAFVLCNHEKGSIFKALDEGLRSNSLEMAKSCLVIAAWLTHMLHHLPDTGVKSTARKALLDQFINVLQSSKNLEEKVLATLALRTFISDPGALQELGAYARCIYKNLRKLKRSSVMVSDILKALLNFSSVNATELWSYSDVVEIDTSQNGEVLSLQYLKGRILSSHSDGTIKMWDTGKKALRLVQQVREHKKAVTCLCVSSSGDKLYSSSLDKTVRVWAIRPEEIHCVQVHDVKEVVHELSANANAACFISQSPGVKVYNWCGVPKQINLNKNAKCIAIASDKLYCGLSGHNIQEVDLSKSTINAFYSGTRKLLAKQTIHSLHIHNGFLFAGGSSVDGIAGKVFCLSSKAVAGSFTTGLDIQRICASNDFIFTATKCGVIEVWLKERVSRLGSIRVGTGHARITSLTSDFDGGMLYAGSSDGKIQVWAMD